MGPFAFAPTEGATLLNLDIKECQLLTSADDLANLMTIADGLFPDTDDDGHLKPWTIVNRGRLASVAYGCPTDAMLHFELNLTKAGDPLRAEFARSFGKSLHSVVADITCGNSPAEALNQWSASTDQALSSLITEAVDSKVMDAALGKVEQWSRWLERASGVMQTKLALGAYGSPTSMTKVETPVGIAWPLEKLIVMTIPDGIGVWNDGGWCFEAKSIAANRNLHQAAIAYERSLQVTIQSVATMLQLRDSGVPFMGTMLDFYVKRAVPVAVDDVKCAKLCECGAASMIATSLTESDYQAIATKHPRSGVEAAWCHDHVATEAGKLANFERKQRAARLDNASWPELIFRRDPSILSMDDLQRRVSRDLGNAVERYQAWQGKIRQFHNYSCYPPLYEMERNTDECFVFSPCRSNMLCNDARLSTLSMIHKSDPPEGYVTRQPDYVDVVVGGGWPTEGYDVYEWDDEGGDE